MLYALSTQERAAREVVPKDCSIDGNATFTIVMSRNTMKTARDVSHRTFQRRASASSRTRRPAIFVSSRWNGPGANRNDRDRRHAREHYAACLLGPTRQFEACGANGARATIPALQTTKETAVPRLNAHYLDLR